MREVGAENISFFFFDGLRGSFLNYMGIVGTLCGEIATVHHYRLLEIAHGGSLMESFVGEVHGLMIWWLDKDISSGSTTLK